MVTVVITAMKIKLVYMMFLIPMTSTKFVTRLPPAKFHGFPIEIYVVGPALPQLTLIRV